MMIAFSPQVRPGTLVLSRLGDVLTINNVAYDFSLLAEGDLLPLQAVGCDLLVSDVTRIGGVIKLVLILPLNESASQAARFPVPIIAPNGVIEVPT